MVSPGARRESWAGRAVPLGQAEASRALSRVHSLAPQLREGHGACRPCRNVLVAKLNTRGSSPKCFLGFSLQKGGWGRREDKDKFLL